MPPATPHTSLAIQIDQWRGEIGRYFGFGRTYSSMTSTQKEDVDSVIDRGLRQFYAPPVLADGTAHIWSFMRPTMDITVHAPYSTGTISNVDSSPAVVNFAGSTLPTWITNGVLLYDHPSTEKKTILHIHTKTSNTQCELEDAVIEDEFSGGTVPYVITDGIYALPTSFGGIEGDITLKSGSGYMPVRQVGDDQIREMFLNQAIQTGVPSFFCVRPWRHPNMDRIGNSGKIGMYTRYELVLFPRPDATYQMSFRYLFVFPGLSDYTGNGESATDTHPPGMAYHHETILASCLAVAEEYADSPNGKHRENFKARIAASVSLDRKVAGTSYFGQNIDRSDTLNSQGRARPSVNITYDNVLY